jgi:hypothetical protein
MNTKNELIELLDKFNRSRPGFDLANYSSLSNYRSDLRPVTLAKRHNDTLLSFIARRDDISVDAILSEFSESRRLTVSQGDKGPSVHYTAGQYYPVEYRKALRAGLISLVWAYFREHCGCDTREKIQKQARLSFGRSIAKLFN